jgi:predicted transcriptional regulator
MAERRGYSLLEVHDNSNSYVTYYVTTERGLEFVEKWRKLEEYLKKRCLTD